jgi:hypothetical protein
MNARAIALVVPLALGTACTHAGQSGAMSRGEPQEPSAGSTASSAPLAKDPIMQPGPAIQGHGEDQIVFGRIAEATGSQVTIQTPQGEKRTLQIVPETMVQLDGQDAASQDLAEGQPVRASFDVVDGQEVAVKIRAGDVGPASQGTGSSSTDQGTGASDQATPPPAPDPGNATPDAGWGQPGSSGSPAPTDNPHW